MGVFAYTAINLAEQQITGTLLADTARDGRERLRAQGLRIVVFAPARLKQGAPRIGLWARRGHQERIAEVARYLSLLLRAGVPLSDALEVLTRQESGSINPVLKAARDQVIGGESLAEALAAHPQWFDGIFVSAVRVGELTGHLDESLAELGDYLRSRQSLRSQLVGALTYPLILVWVSVLVVLFLMSFVVPELMTVLAAAGRPLPASTMFLKSGSDLLITYWWAVLGGVVAIVAAAGALYRHEPSRRAAQQWQLRIPILGPLIQRSVVAQFAQQMSVMLKTGIPFVDAVRMVAGLTNHLILRDELNAVRSAVESGSDIAPTMSHSRVFPPVVVQLVAVGQDSGELTEMLAELKSRYETEVRLALTRFTTALEPMLIVLLAMAVGFVVYACLMPILEATRGIT
jgi:type II secretory pathway component PulF